MRQFFICAALLLLAAACASDKTSKGPSVKKAPEGKQTVNQLSESYYEEYLKLFPQEATSIGDNRYNDRLDFDISTAHLKTQAELYDTYLARLGEINPHELTSEDHLTYDVFKHQLETRREILNWPYELLPIRQLYSLPVVLPLLGSGKGLQPFRTVRDYDNFLKRAGDFPAWVDIAIANMREGIHVGVVQAKVVVDKTIPQLQAMIVTNAPQSIFYQPIQNFPIEISPADRQRLEQAYSSLILKQLVPAYRKLADFLRLEYRPRCRDAHGIWVLPKGRAWYRQAIRQYTTTDLTPDEIHEIGKAEVMRIELAMERIKIEAGFKGTLPNFVDFLQKRPGIGFTNRQDYVHAYELLRAQVEPRLTNLFGLLPKASFEIRAIEEFREASAPSHYFAATPDGSRPGIFYANASGIKRGPAAISEALFLHEALPGHHLQISIAQEQTGLPRLRRFAHYNAYIEGWALYAESLGGMLGCYTDPLQQMDRLSSEMWRARRLVVDTGIHEERWTRDQAIQYLRENPVQVMNAELEVDRYIAWPGQALSYKIGEIRIRQIRDKTKPLLKGKYDLRQFHDQILKDGALPLDVLDRKIEVWAMQLAAQP
jgi:uncharacterized protein (DUF885 family)